MDRIGRRLAAACLLIVASATAWASDGPAGTMPAPDATDSFSFIVFPDRTGGPASGVRVLEQAVNTANLLDPDFVITIGDMIQGYADAETWLAQAAEYKSIMDRLTAPWYPVAGNHDLYARPHTEAGHLALYREHFGPLYYSFTHRFAHFVVLWTDESMRFDDPARTQNVSPEQLAWLEADLAAAEADRVFVFMHHPRWLDAYAGSNWPQAHRLLEADARPVTVFAGHVHSVRDDGPSGNVRYLTLGTAGAHPSRAHPHASFDHVTLVHARPDGESIVHVPLGTLRSPEAFPGREMDELSELARGEWIVQEGTIRVSPEAGQTSTVRATLTNPATKPVEAVVTLDLPPGWTASPRECRVRLDPGEPSSFAFEVTAGAIGDRRPQPALRVRARYPVSSGGEEAVSVRRPIAVEAVLPDPAETRGVPDGFLRLDGRSALRVDLPERPDRFTLEAWVRSSAPKGRQGVLCNTESSGFGIFWSDAPSGESLPAGYLHAGGRYARAQAPEPWDWARWTHLALVHDGETLTLFVDGRPAASSPTDGEPLHNALPLMVGADVNASSEAVSFWTGDIDEVRFSSVARYTGPFEPARRHEPDADTLLLLHLDAAHGAVFPDASDAGAHAWAVGAPVVAPHEDR